MKFRLFINSIMFAALALSGAESDFIRQGKTDHVIVIPDQPDVGSQFALQELQTFLKKASGAEFKSVPSSKAPSSKRIFLGLSDAALKALGKDPRPDMKDQDFRVRTTGSDLFLFGQGSWGSMYAVYDYLENVLGYRWYDARGGMKTPDCSDLKWRKLDRSGNFSVKYRGAVGYWIFHRPQAHLAFLRNRQNYSLIDRFLKMKGINIPPQEEVSASGTHTLPCYIPGEANRNVYKPFPWLKNQNYWKTNPEFFGVRENGRRSGGSHLCFSNPGLRKELTANILENMKRQADKTIFSVSAHDSPGRFCHCEKCLALEKKYQTPGGAYFDYLIELGKTVSEKFPGKRISFLVYRKNQTQVPPAVDRLPASLLPIFAPIDDDFGKSWAHPNNEKTRQDLRRWGKISSGLAVWYYPNPYSGDITPPLGNIRRLVSDIREMIAAGMTHTYFEHNVGVANMIGFTELQSFLILQLLKDSSQDADALIREFVEFEYGKAAPLMLKYLDELEKASAKNQLYMSWNAPISAYDHLTAENMVRWHGYFTEMEKLLADRPVQLENLKRVKINLECAMLLRYNRIIHKYPGFKIKPKTLADSIQKQFRKTIRDFFDKGFEFRAKNALRSLDDRIGLALIQAGKEGKALPPEIFGKIPPEQIMQFVPRVNGRDFESDSDAAWGVAAVQMTKPVPKLPYPAHVYDYAARKYHPSLMRVTKKNIGPRGQYKIYLVTKKFVLSPNCMLQIGEDSWFQIRANLGEAYEDGSLNQVMIYASLKFEGPAFYPEDAGKTDRVLCDRVIVVKLP